MNRDCSVDQEQNGRTTVRLWSVASAEQADLGALCSGDQGLANVTNGEAVGGLDLVPVLLGERIGSALHGQLFAPLTAHRSACCCIVSYTEHLRLLLATFLALGNPLVLADCHAGQLTRPLSAMPKRETCHSTCSVRTPTAAGLTL